ncbi:MAG TPA: orotidine-5'-phosphate decarboxylase [Alphaproteobacteria bacterium]
MTIYVPIDTPDIDTAKRIAALVTPAGCGIKLGMEFFNAHGPQGIAMVKADFPEASLFIDLKYHDIPNTVAGAVRSIAKLAPDYLNVHASGGFDMMKAAKDALQDESAKLGLKNTPKLLAVTVLTSIDARALHQVGQGDDAEAQVERLAILTKNAGLDGVVCSPLEIEIVRRACGPDFVTMVPGIRPADAAAQDQKRVMTPRDAALAGATHLVIGRPITQAPDPAQAARDILASMAA